MMPECRHAAFELAWSDKPEEDKGNKRSVLLASHTHIILCKISLAIFDVTYIFYHLRAILVISLS